MARQVTLVVEDGTIIAGANSFVTEQQIVDYALARGVTLPFATDGDKDKVAVLGIKAADYLMIMPWKGEVVSSTQTMPWPRKNLGVTPSFPEDAIPLAVVEAQLQLTLLSNAGTVLIPVSLGTGLLIKEKIGPIENVYSEKAGISLDGLPILPGVSALLDPWLLGSFDGFTPVMIRSVGDKSYGC
jgi:hypothetical protein